MSEALAGVVLDFDGVIVDSVDVKTRAFAAVFSSEAPDHVARILDYHAANNGISRYEKFRWAYREVLKRPLPTDVEMDLGARYNRLVEDAVVSADWIPGARAFLENLRLPAFVASGTPEEELKRIVARRGIEGLFSGVRGTPDKKEKILSSIAASLHCSTSRLAMIGDASSDHDAARAVGAAFVGIVGTGRENPFPRGTSVLPDLSDLARTLGLEETPDAQRRAS